MTKPLNDRPWWNRFTSWGLILMGGARAAEATGQIPEGTTQAIVDLAESVGPLLTIFGFYRHIAAD